MFQIAIANSFLIKSFASFSGISISISQLLLGIGILLFIFIFLKNHSIYNKSGIEKYFIVFIGISFILAFLSICLLLRSINFHKWFIWLSISLAWNTNTVDVRWTTITNSRRFGILLRFCSTDFGAVVLSFYYIKKERKINIYN